MAEAPKGCDASISSIYYNLCDLTTVWGIVVEAVAAAGVVTSFVLFIILMATLPFVTDKKRKGMVALQAGILIFTLEVIINTEWLIITVVRSPVGNVIPDLSCRIANQDFVLSLMYVMVLLLAVVLMPVPSLRHKHKQWRRDGAFILITGLFTLAIWVAWIVMYIHGNIVAGSPTWDDPTLAVAVVSNAWVFLFLYTIPEICLLTLEDPDQEEPHDGDVYPARSLVYDNILKEPEPPQQNIYLENKAFTMDEPPTVPTKPVSPYGAYNGQLRSGVYQPTEIALIAKGLTKMDQDAMIPRARAPSLIPGSGSSLPRSVESFPP